MDGNINFAGRRLKLKTKIMIRFQDLLLNTLGRVPVGSYLQLAVQFLSKRLVGAYPYIIKLDVTDVCNLNCKMCYSKNEGRKLPFDKVLFILNQIKDVPMRLDILGGEPLLRDDICKIIEYVKTNTKIREIVLYTNGTLVSKALAKDLFKAGLTKAIVTLISHNQQRHDKFTGIDGSWNRTIAGIRNLTSSGIRTYTFTALHSENIADFEEIYRYVREELKISPLFYQYVPQRKNDPLLIPNNEWHRVKNKLLSKYRQEHMEYIKRVLSFSSRLCLGGYYSISVKVDGSVTPCPFISDISLGNVFKESIWDIFAKRFKSPEFCQFMRLPAECRNCSYRNLCAGACRAGNNMLFGTYFSRDCRCNGPFSDTVCDDCLPERIPTFF